MPQKEDGKKAFNYVVCLSFAGEDRAYVENVAEYLTDKGIQVFYDRYEEATLWGKDLAVHLSQVYSKESQYCIIFISKHYASKVFPNHELKNALSRAIESTVEYLLPARFDDTELPGLRKTIGYVDLQTKTAEELGKLIIKKVNGGKGFEKIDPSKLPSDYCINNDPNNRLKITRIEGDKSALNHQMYGMV